MARRGATITYEEAVGSLRAMFPKFDSAVIEMVLQNNSGAMEPTVEALLVMDGDSTAVADAAREAADAAEAARIAAAADAAEGGGDDGGEYDDDSDVDARDMHGTVGLGIPVTGPPVMPAPAQLASSPAPRFRHTLPADFLRFPGVGLPALPGQPNVAQAAPHGHGSSSAAAASHGGIPHPHLHRTSTTDAQMAADEAMAATLQNALFLEQVRADPELAAYILRDPRGAAAMGLPVHLILPALQAQQAAARGGGRGGGGGAPWYADSDDAAMARAGRGATPTHSSAGSRSGGADSVSGGPASGAAHAPSSSWMTGMQRRLNAMAARFRRNNNAAGGPEGASGAVAPAPGSTAARVEPVPGAGAAARPAVPSAGGSWFSGRRSGYLGLPGPAGDAAAAHASSSDGAPPGGVGSDGSRSGRRSYGGGGGASLGAEAGDIELTEAAPPAAIAAALAPGSGSKAGVAGSLNGAAGRPVGVGAPGGAAAAGAPGAVNPHPFAIDDEEDEEEPEGDESETRALTLARGTRHV